MSKADVLFWLNVFGWIYEPRTAKSLPFITFDFQDVALRAICSAIGYCDIGIEKSRDMGVSWMLLAPLIHRTLFFRLQRFMLVSRKEILVDKEGDSDSLMWKGDFLLKHLPPWMRPRLGISDRTSLHYRNPATDSAIDGASTTGNVGRGGRRTAVGIDEAAAFQMDHGYGVLAATQANTNSRLFLSTPQGSEGMFHDVMHDDDQLIVKVRLHWEHHPFKNRGLYTTEGGKIKILDESYRFPRDYPFVLDAEGKVRSPWYDIECRRCPVPQIIAQELDIDYVGSSHLAFDREIVAKAIRQDARPAYRKGELSYISDSAEPTTFIEDTTGRLSLWTHLDANNEPPHDCEYVVGSDIAWGTQDRKGRGATVSAASVYNRVTGAKVASLVVGGVDPKEYAKMVVALCRWFRGDDDEGAFLIWEANGPGRPFGEEVMRLSYMHIYYRRREDIVSKKQTEMPGWWSTKDGKVMLLTEYQRALASGECCNRCEDSLRELEKFVVLPDRSWEHLGGVSSLDPTQSRENHGDRAIGDALCWHVISSVKPDEFVRGGAREAPPLSMAARRKEEEDRKYERDRKHRRW